MFKVLGGIRVDLYASGGTSFACCYKLQNIRISKLKGRLSQYRLLRDLGYIHSGARCLSSGRVVDDQGDRLVEWSSSRLELQLGWSILLDTIRAHQ